jgi:N,N-dimethylformamidase beta subunit-like protein/flagellar hook capping protein FlgD
VTTFARAMFAALVLATLGAFFAAQRIKNSPPVVQDIGRLPVFSPNGDGRFDRERITFRIRETDEITVDVVDDSGEPVRRLLEGRLVHGHEDLVTLKWDGRTDAGDRAPDGIYRVRVALGRQGRSIVVPKSFVLDTTPPRPIVFAIGPESSETPQPELLPLPRGGSATAHLRAAERKPEILLFKTAPGPPRLVLSEKLEDGATRWRWNGRKDGRPVSPGPYLVVVRSRDRAGNIGASVALSRRGLPVAPYGLPVPGRGGITVRYVGIQPPNEPVRAGDIAEFFVDTRRKRYRWSLRRVGGPQRPIRRGGGTRARLRIHAPNGRSGLYLLTVRTRRHASRVAFAVQGRRSAGGTPGAPRGVLVVLPVMTWQGRNAVDDDGDGVPNTLTAGRASLLARVYGGDGLPVGLSTHEAPVAAFLDRHGLRYDVTTDVALAFGHAPPLAAYRGLLVPGDTRWLPASVGRALRRFALAGGRVASLGTASLRRLVRVTPGGRLADPTAPAATDVFGARLRPIVRRPVTLTILQDRIGLFEGGGGLFTGIEAYEATSSAGRGARIVASAVTPSGQPVVVAARVGRGLVIRPGLPDFAAALRVDPATANLMGRVWTLLSR